MKDDQFQFLHLKKCPFCGGFPMFVFLGDYETGGQIAVQCRRCKATVGVDYQGPPINIPLMATAGAQVAQKRWNKRWEKK